MGRIRAWWSRLFAAAPDPVPEEPAAWIAYKLERMTPAARLRAEALRQEAAEDFGSLDKADDWLTGAIPFLGDRIPIDMMHDETGAKAVMIALHNMRYGIFS